MVRAVLRTISRPVTRLLRRTVSIQDPWQRYVSVVPLRIFGVGARWDFPWYFEGRSRVPVASIDEVQDWLMGCEYVCDPDLFDEIDYWQHPCAFEQIRKGDCEDFSLWAWRKLIRLGYEAEFVAGRFARVAACGSGHTWLHIHTDQGTQLFDPVVRRHEQMIRPLEEMRDDYLPEVSVDPRFTRYVYGGYFLREEGRAKREGGVRALAGSELVTVRHP